MEGLRFNHKRIFSVNQAKLMAFLVATSFLFNFTLLPIPVMAATIPENNVYLVNTDGKDEFLINNDGQFYLVSNAPWLVNNYFFSELFNFSQKIDINNITIDNVEVEVENIGIIDKNKEQSLNFLPQNPDKKVKTSLGYHLATAYNSEPSQTDASPCITANGFNVCKHGQEDTVAANFLPFGTKIKIPTLFGDRIFVVRDRMHPRFGNRIDVWMKDKADALKFGVKHVKVEIVE